MLSIQFQLSPLHKLKGQFALTAHLEIESTSALSLSVVFSSLALPLPQLVCQGETVVPGRDELTLQ